MKKIFTPLLLFFCITAAGCGTKYPVVEGQSEVLGNVINIGKDGEYRSLPIDGIQPAQEMFNFIFEQINAFLEEDASSSGQSSDIKQILIYVHGGLNTYETAMERVVDATKAMKDTNTYPVFINWRSGPRSTLGDHYFRIRYGKAEKDAALVSPIYVIGDIAKTAGNIPMAWYHEGAQVVKTTFLENDNEDLKGDLKRGVVSRTEDDDNRWDFGRRAVWTVTAPFKLITTPFVFTLGKPAWDNMKRRTHTMFVAEDDLKQPELQSPPSASNGTMLRFLKQLNNHIKEEREEGYDCELTLMGHSMGGIIINRALRDLPDLEVDNIVYMASADNLQNYLDATLSTLNRRKAQGKDLQIYNLHLHPENENREISFFGLLPSGSLLAWIDHTYDSPEYFLQRTSGRWSNIRKVINLIPQENRGNYHFKVFGRGNAKISPQKHGSFDENAFKFWQKSYWTGFQVY